MSLIVKCIDNNNIQNVELNNLYNVSILTKTNVKLLDPYARLNYSIKRFNIVEYNDQQFDIPLENFINKYLEKNPKPQFIYIDKRVKYDLTPGKYLISFRDKIENVKLDDIFKNKNNFSQEELEILNRIKDVEKQTLPLVKEIVNLKLNNQNEEA